MPLDFVDQEQDFMTAKSEVFIVIKILLKIIYLMILFFSFNQAGHAFSLTPSVAILEPSGAKATQVYLLTNTTSNPAAIQFNVTTRQQRKNGTEIRDPAQNLFNIHPAQVIIPSGGTQKVRVKWLGKKAVMREQAYRFIAEQLPIKLSKEKQFSINLVMKFEAALYVKPAGQQSLAPKQGNSTAKEAQGTNSKAVATARLGRLKITTVQVVNTPKGKQLLLSIKNPDDEHIILNNAQVQLSSGVRGIRLAGKQLGNLPGQNMLSRATRNFTMPIPANFIQQQKWTGRFIFLE